MKQHFGFVLRTYFPQKHKISLFDENFGRIEGLVLSAIILQAISSGMLLSYNLKPKGSLFRLEGINIYKVPFRAARNDIYFLHQVLELCYYFLPLHQTMPAIFYLINFVVQSSEQLHTSLCKKLFLLRFFAHLGMHPDEDLYNMDLLQNLLSQPIDSMLNTDVIAESKLDQWLYDFIADHPQKAQFKTVISGYSDAQKHI
jgi:hypothetical protein